MTPEAYEEFRAEAEEMALKVGLAFLDALSGEEE